MQQDAQPRPKKLFLVETINVFRHRYAVLDDNTEYAADTVVCNENNHEFEELSQKYLGETITSVREITDAEYLQIFDQDNDYLRGWTDDQKRRFIHDADAVNADDEDDDAGMGDD